MFFTKKIFLSNVFDFNFDLIMDDPLDVLIDFNLFKLFKRFFLSLIYSFEGQFLIISFNSPKVFSIYINFCLGFNLFNCFLYSFNEVNILRILYVHEIN